MQYSQDPPTWVGNPKQKDNYNWRVSPKEQGCEANIKLPSLEVLKQKDELPEAWTGDRWGLSMGKQGLWEPETSFKILHTNPTLWGPTQKE